MRQSFHFDKETGTMVASEQRVMEQPIDKPVLDEGESITKNAQRANISVDEGVVSFRERSDLTIFQISDEQSGSILGYISGYALDINFNMSELRSTERVEQFLNGLTKMFREIILEKAFSSQK